MNVDLTPIVNAIYDLAIVIAICTGWFCLVKIFFGR